jgi:predicted acetyltransferase
VTFEIRLTTPDDAAAAWALGSLAFGYHHETMPADWATRGHPGRWQWGIFDGGRLLAKAVDREQGHWFGGRVVPAAGVAGVAVAADVRGTGLGRQVLNRLLIGAHERGAVISTLFDTTPFPYRQLGWEEVGALTKTAVPAMIFSGLRVPGGITTRAATVDDVPAIHEIYETVARAGTGLMDRTGPAFTRTPEEELASWDGVTVAAGRDGVVGYSTWDRGPGYDASGRVIVGDLIGLTTEATTALLAMLGQWGSVAPTVVLRYGGPDPVHLLTSVSIHGRVEQSQPWMLRLVDVAGAVAARGWSPLVSGSVDVHLTDVECPWNSGTFRLVLGGGEARWEPGGTGLVRFTPRGLASWYAGAASPDTLRRAGLLDGPTDGDPFLLAATAGPAPTLLNYF